MAGAATNPGQDRSAGHDEPTAPRVLSTDADIRQAGADAVADWSLSEEQIDRLAVLLSTPHSGSSAPTTDAA